MMKIKGKLGMDLYPIKSIKEREVVYNVPLAARPLDSNPGSATKLCEPCASSLTSLSLGSLVYTMGILRESTLKVIMRLA